MAGEMTYQDTMRAITEICVKRRQFTFLEKLTQTADGFEALIYTRLQDPRALDQPLDRVGLNVRQIEDKGGAWYVFSLVVKGKKK